jgi:hypothetical protein
LRNILRFFADRLIERSLVWPRINDSQKVTLFYVLAFLESDFLNLAIHPRLNRHHVESLDRSDTV